jgi:hypothetical protein
MQRVGGSDETAPNVVFNEGLERTQLQRREGVHAARRRSLTFLKVNFEVVGVMFRECFRFTLAEDIRELMVFVRVVDGDQRPHADMSNKRLYSAFLRYMSDPRLHVTRCHISVSPGNPQGQQDHTMYL